MFLGVVLAMLECGKCGIQGLCTRSCSITPVQGTRATRAAIKAPTQPNTTPAPTGAARLRPIFHSPAERATRAAIKAPTRPNTTPAPTDV